MTSESAAFFVDAFAIRPIQDFEISTAEVNSNSRCRAARSRHCAMSIMPFETNAAVAAAITTELNNSLFIIVRGQTRMPYESNQVPEYSRCAMRQDSNTCGTGWGRLCGLGFQATECSDEGNCGCCSPNKSDFRRGVSDHRNR